MKSVFLSLIFQIACFFRILNLSPCSDPLLCWPQFRDGVCASGSQCTQRQCTDEERRLFESTGVITPLQKSGISIV